MSLMKDKIWRRIKKAPDLDLAIKLTRIDNEEFVNIRDFVPSTKRYGHGVVFPTSLLPQIAEGLQELQVHLGINTSREPGPGQEKAL